MCGQCVLAGLQAGGVCGQCVVRTAGRKGVWSVCVGSNESKNICQQEHFQL